MEAAKPPKVLTADFGWLAKEFPVPMNVAHTGNDSPK